MVLYYYFYETRFVQICCWFNQFLKYKSWMSKINKIIVTGGAGFVGTNLIKLLLKKTKFKIISIDNYSSGKRKTMLEIIELNIIKEIQEIYLQ